MGKVVVYNFMQVCGAKISRVFEAFEIGELFRHVRSEFIPLFLIWPGSWGRKYPVWKSNITESQLA